MLCLTVLESVFVWFGLVRDEILKIFLFFANLDSIILRFSNSWTTATAVYFFQRYLTFRPQIVFDKFVRKPFSFNCNENLRL